MALALAQAANGYNAANGTTIAASFGSASAAGSLLYAIVRQGQNSSFTCTLTDDAGNTWTAIDNIGQNASQTGYTFYVKNALATTTVTATFSSGSITRSIIIVEITGADTGAPLDVHVTDVESAQTVYTSGSLTTSQSNEIF